MLVVTVAAVTAAVLVFAGGDFGPEEARSRFFGIMLLFAGAMLVTVTATTLAVLLMGWEVMGAASWALIGFWWHDRRRVETGTVAFVTTRPVMSASSGRGCGHRRWGRLAPPRCPAQTGGAVARPGRRRCHRGCVRQVRQLPFSFWLSRAMEGPSPVSALLHSATMVAAGAYLLLRLEPLLAASGWAQPTVAWVGAATAVALGLVAVAQRDLKQLLAASTCAQIGFMVLVAGVGGVGAGTAQLVAHAATKSLLFLPAGAWLSALGTK